MAETNSTGNRPYDDMPPAVEPDHLAAGKFQQSMSDQIRMFEEGMLSSAQAALKSSAEDVRTAGAQLIAAMKGEAHAQEQVSDFVKNAYSALTNSDTYKKMAETLGEKAGEAQIALEKGRHYDAGMVFGAAMVEFVGPGKTKAAKALAEVGEDASLAAKAGNLAKDVGHGAPDAPLEGELLSKHVTGQEVAVPQSPAQALSVQEKAKALSNSVVDAVQNPFETILKKFSSPETDLAVAAYKTKPGLLDTIDARHHGLPGEEQQLYDQHHQVMDRAAKMNQALNNPDAVSAEQLQQATSAIKGMGKEQLDALVKDGQFDRALDVKPLQPGLPSPAYTQIDEAIAGLHDGHAVNRQAALDRMQQREQMGAAEKAWDTIKGGLTSPGGARPSQNDMERLALAEKDSDVIKMLARGVGEKYVVGKAIVAGSMVAAGIYATQQDEERAQRLSPNERLADLFDRTAGAAEKEQEVLKSHQELKPLYDSYHQAVDEAFKRHPRIDGRADDAAGEIYRARHQLMDFIKQGGLDKESRPPEQRSSVENLLPEQKVAEVARFINSLPEHQRGVYQEAVAAYAQGVGIKVTETHVQQQQVEAEPQRG